MAGASFGTGFNANAGVPKPPKPPKGPGASLTGLHNPVQGSGFSGLHAPAPPQAGGPAVPPPAASPGSSGPQSPLDSTYYADIAANQLKVNNSLNGLNAQSANNNTALQSALGQLAYQQPRDQLKVEQAANRRGALYSSVEGQDQGNLLNQYQTKQSADTAANSQKQAAIAAQIAALQQGEGLFNNNEYDSAVARAIKAAAANPATGQAPIAAPAAPVAAPKAAPIPPAYKGYKIGAGIPKAKPNQIGYRGGF